MFAFEMMDRGGDEEIATRVLLAFGMSTVAGLSTGIGALLMVIQEEISLLQLGLWQGAAAGFMLSVSLLDIIPEVWSEIGDRPLSVALSFSAGALLFIAIKLFVPDVPLVTVLQSGMSPTVNISSREKKAALLSGLKVALAIALHNVPEGVAVCFATLRGLEFGAPLTFAIAVHNIPEGVACAVPIYYATKNRSLTLGLTLLSGLAEPAGVILFLGLAKFGYLTKQLVSFVLAGVAGTMITLSLLELVPLACAHAGMRRAYGSVLFGAAAMAGLLRLAQWVTLSDIPS